LTDSGYKFGNRGEIVGKNRGRRRRTIQNLILVCLSVTRPRHFIPAVTIKKNFIPADTQHTGRILAQGPYTTQSGYGLAR